MKRKAHRPLQSKLHTPARVCSTMKKRGDKTPGSCAANPWTEGKVPADPRAMLGALTQPKPGEADMNNEIKELRELINQLRADQAATDAALLAVFLAIPDVYRERVLKDMLELHLERERFVEQIPNAQMQVAAERITEAQERMWKVLQEAHLRASQPKG